MSQDAQSLYSCKLCNEVLKKTQMTICCLSRYCESCITDYVKANSKQCPSCQKTISDGSIRADTHFDSLIALNLPKHVQVKAEPENPKSDESVVSYLIMIDDGFYKQKLYLETGNHLESRFN